MEEAILTPEEGLNFIRNLLQEGERAYKYADGYGESPSDLRSGKPSEAKAAPETLGRGPFFDPEEIVSTAALDLSFLGGKADLTLLPEMEIHQGQDRVHDYLPPYEAPAMPEEPAVPTPVSAGSGEKLPDAPEVATPSSAATVPSPPDVKPAAQQPPMGDVPEGEITEPATPSPTAVESPPAPVASPPAPVATEPGLATTDVPSAAMPGGECGSSGCFDVQPAAEARSDAPSTPTGKIEMTPEQATRMAEEMMKILKDYLS